eukprot:6728846-Pyramimonas_sp.AAC.1
MSEGASLPFAEWWTQVSTCKSVGQWGTKLQAFVLPQAELANISSFNKVGQMLFARLLKNGAWAQTDQQCTLSQ